jgi:Xaa-Pro aminopeptidase
MRYTPLSADFYTKNRKNLSKLLKPNSLVILESNDILPTNADGHMAFRQQNDLFYLTGIDQGETVLILYPDAPVPEWREMLFLKETSEQIKIWEGYKLTKQEARNQSGIEQVKWNTEWRPILQALMNQAEYVYLATNEHPRSVVETQTRNDRLIRELKEKFPLHAFERLAPKMEILRAVKHPEEVAQISKAIEITREGFLNVLKTTRPGLLEYELEAEFAYSFLKKGSKGFAYGPIIASGPNANVLHYTDNDKPMEEGHLILIDVGAEYGNYNADMTRCIPANGKFSPRQRQVYEAVLRVMKSAAKLLRPGITLLDYEKKVGKIMEKELVGLGLLKQEELDKQDPEKPLYKKYFMHGTSHHLGLDVHDLGSKYRFIEPGMVFTCEPGIYIPEEGLGIRLENNFLVTETEPIDLMASIPLEPDEIEKWMSPQAKN